MKILALVLITLAIVSARDYPLFKQCDDSWGSEELGPGPKTICRIGCLISSVSMALNSYGVQIDGQEANPSTLNQWLSQNGGYSSQLFVWGSVSSFGFSYQGQVSAEEGKEALDQSNVVILNVRNGGHWVLATSYDGDTFYVNDPGYDCSTYSASEVEVAAVFSVSSSSFLAEAYNFINNFLN
ncbi:hypothetical protein ABPG74_006588 [Tetrahymena malaccensis]